MASTRHYLARAPEETTMAAHRRAKQRQAAESLKATRELFQRVRQELDTRLERARQQGRENGPPVEDELERTWDDWYREESKG